MIKDEMRLSLCIITKNDEAFLPDCLNDMKGTADEFLVADLGSTDRTVDLAQEAGAVLYRPEWEDNFSKIKNFCMEHATGKWVLFLQADEKIDKGQLKELRFLLKNPNAEAYFIYAGYNPEERSITSHTQFLRLLRNRKEYRFCCRSFEWIPDETLYSVCASHLCITHRGEKTVGWQLEERRRLLKEEGREHPRDGYLQYLEGLESLNEGKFEESADFLEQARRSIGCGRFYGPQLYKCLGVSLLSLDRYEQAEKILREGFQLFPFYNDLLVLHAVLCSRVGRNRDALKDLESCLSLREKMNPFVPMPEISNSVIQEIREEIRDKRGPQP